VRDIQQFHQDVRGWSDIGYHFLLDLEGRIYQGRPFADESIPFDQGPPLVIGAHVGGHNTGNIGVTIMGCFHPPEGSHCVDQLTPAARDSLVLLLAYLIDTYGIDPLHIRGHREWPSASTACPGDNNMALLPSIRQEVAELLERGTRRPAELVAEVSVDADGVVRLRWNFVTVRNASRLTIVRQTGVRMPHYADWLRVVVFLSPFTEEARLRYYLRIRAWVEADLFDVLGRPVRRLIRGYVTSGWHGVSFDLRGAATGMYYVRFRFGIEMACGIV